MQSCLLAATVLGVAVVAVSPGAAPGPLSPRDELATFRIAPGFKIELVACEPDIVDPVAMAFDERGRMFVAEMRGYPNGGVATGKHTGGRVRCLEDRDGDGFFETATTYADGLRFPTAVMPWRGGVIVGNAPEILFCDDTGQRRVLYTGFDLDNIQQLINSLQFGLDNWVHGCAGNKGGVIRSPEKPDMPPLALRGRGVRFRPDVPGSLEATSGGGQYGLAADAFGNWFTATNSQHLRHIILPDHVLARNPYLSVPAITLDIPDHDPACKVFRISPFESWRVERTGRRVADPKFANWPSAEKVPGGFITSGCSPLIYSADRFPPAYRGNSFVCDPANNLIHRDRLEPAGITFVARRADEGCEFLASTDNWFRPVWLTLGPDGATYVLDFYREVIETPLSLPDDIKAKLNLESRGRGRIWRIAPEDGRKPQKIDLRPSTAGELASLLADGNSWKRLTAQRLLIERQDQAVVPVLERMVRQGATPESRVHALWTLDGLHALTDSLFTVALSDPEAPVREHALKLAATRIAGPSTLRTAVCCAANDPDPRVRAQAAIAAGTLEPSAAIESLIAVLERDGGDPWLQSAALSSAAGCGAELLTSIAADPRFADKPFRGSLLHRIAGVIGAKGDQAELARVFERIAAEPVTAAWKPAVLAGIGQALQNGKLTFELLWQKPPPDLARSLPGLRRIFDIAANQAQDASRSVGDRASALRLLAFASLETARHAVTSSVGPQNPPELQSAALTALAAHNSREVAEIILGHWDSFGSAQRRESIEVLCSRAERVAELLDAVESQRVLPNQIEPARRDWLRKHRDPALRRRAQALLTAGGSAERAKVVAAFSDVLDLPADATRGAAVFQKVCASCHRLGNLGHDVGPDLRSALGNKTPEALLIDILDPNREIDSRYVVYQAATRSGRLFTGVLAVDTAASITLRRAEQAEDTILRSQLESLTATTVSLMPDEIEKLLSKQELADVIAFLLAPTTRK